MKQPFELMKQLRLADTGELREILESLQEENPEAYAALADKVEGFGFKRAFKFLEAEPDR